MCGCWPLGSSDFQLVCIGTVGVENLLGYGAELAVWRMTKHGLQGVQPELLLKRSEKFTALQ